MIFGDKLVTLNEFTIDSSFSYLFIGIYWSYQARVDIDGDIKNTYVHIKICVIPFIAFNFRIEYKYLKDIDSVQNISQP